MEGCNYHTRYAFKCNCSILLNQRLCGIEDNLKIQTPDGQEISITEIYRQQAEAELAAQANEEQGE